MSKGTYRFTIRRDSRTLPHSYLGLQSPVTYLIAAPFVKRKIC